MKKKFIIKKVSINYKVIIIIKIYILNSRAPEHIKQRLTTVGKIDCSIKETTLLSIMDKTTRQKIGMDIEDLNNQVTELDLACTC